MTNQVASTGKPDAARQNACRCGFWVSILTAVSAAAALGIAVTTAPARSGPNCPPLVEMGVVQSCFTYPFTDVAAYVPIEYIWMYPAILLALLFVVLAICVDQCAGVEKKLASQIGLVFAAIAAAVHAINYFIQLAAVQPSLLKGELDALVLFSQYNPHGIFIALEDLGYLLMGIAFLFIALVFTRPTGLERAIRITLIVGSVLAVVSLILFALVYGPELEYNYEVFSLIVDWIVLIVSGILLSVFFKREARR